MIECGPDRSVLDNQSSSVRVFVIDSGLFQKKIPGGGEDGRRYIFLWVVGAHIFQIIWVLGV